MLSHKPLSLAEKKKNSIGETMKRRFNNHTFFSYGGGYFRNSRTTLHRYKYERKYGAILPGFHLHHKDGNKFNNNLNNLELLTAREHISLHKKLRLEKIYKNQMTFEW